MTEVAATRGLQATSVAQVVTRAGVSRRTFYELFEDREACFLAVFDEALARVTVRVEAAVASSGEKWTDRVRAGLLALLSSFDEEPALARVCVVWTLGASPAVFARRAEVLDGLAEFVEQGRGSVRGRGPTPLSAEAVVGAVASIIHARLLAPRPAPLRPMLGELMGLIVFPYRGAAAAFRELSQPAPEIPPPPTSWSSTQDPLRGLEMRITYRTLRVLQTVGAHPGGSNREIGRGAGMSDQGQISKLLARLESLGLIENRDLPRKKGAPNAWLLTQRGREIERSISGPVELEGERRKRG